MAELSTASTTDPLVNIVIVSWNRRDLLRTVLTRVGEQGYRNVEVIVVDNASTDGSPEMVRREFPEACLTVQSENLGVGAYNIGFARSGGKYVVGLDDDSWPAADAIGKAVRMMETHGDVGIIAFRILHPDSGFDSSHGWPSEVTAMIGCGFMVRRDTLEQAGYYDESFFLYCNEDDLAIRVWDLGKRVVYAPEIVAYHQTSSLHRSPLRTIYYFVRNSIWFIYKYFGIRKVALGWLRIITIYLLSAIRRRCLKAWIKGVKDGFLGLNRVRRTVVAGGVQRFYRQNAPEFRAVYRLLLARLR